MSGHSERDLLSELFPESARELFGQGGSAAARSQTPGLYPVADGRLALVSGGQLAEFEPLEGRGNVAFHCDLCHVTRTGSDAGIFRVRRGERQYLYLTLCRNTLHCQRRAGRSGLEGLAQRVFSTEAV